MQKGTDRTRLYEEGKIIPHGFLRSHVLAVLKDGDAHGYEIIKKIEEYTGFWKPSPGTIYPLLKAMVSEGLVSVRMEGEKKIYSLTPRGLNLAKSVEISKKDMHQKMCEMMSLLTNVPPEKLMEIVSTAKKSIRERMKASGLLEALSESFDLIMDVIHNHPEKMEKCAKIVKRANEEIKKVMKE